ncbi:hypothetical protein NCAS_0F03020 [Naumovozyma castellii]|uniref:Uncharacterized protein n=1 Tax=Naumovozyma castellii TaxID=27288 RepID=G0VH14_NAUCA|nr:hypothetical protein NCAS_0F03020 [Naumovozyma castellii CBS 4309]CCC70786.1 hypothetical protein NCAS_0F03020 [Naumovozyma castellii CBS 4309]
MKVQLSSNRTQEIIKTSFDDEYEQENIRTAEEVQESLDFIEDLKFFLTTAPVNWQENQIIRRYYLDNNQGFISCVFWSNLYYITGTDIVKACMYRMEKFGRAITQKKKFEEGIFSDLRNLKCGVDATLEQPKSKFLAFLFRNMCLKTQKKQKVFFWFSVPHDKLFVDALERDLKREAQHQPTTTKAIHEPALSFNYDRFHGKQLYDQLLTHIKSQRETIILSADLGTTRNDKKPSIGSKVIKQENTEIQKVEMANEEGKDVTPYVTSTFTPENLVVKPVNLNPAPGVISDANIKPLTNDIHLDTFPISIEYPENDIESYEAPLLSSTFPTLMQQTDGYFEPYMNFANQYVMPSSGIPFQPPTPFIFPEPSNSKTNLEPSRQKAKNRRQTIEISNNGKTETIQSAKNSAYQNFAKTGKNNDHYMQENIEAYYRSQEAYKQDYPVWKGQSSYNPLPSSYGSNPSDFLPQMVEQPNYGFEGFSPLNNIFPNDYSYSQQTNANWPAIAPQSIIVPNGYMPSQYTPNMSANLGSSYLIRTPWPQSATGKFHPSFPSGKLQLGRAPLQRRPPKSSTKVKFINANKIAKHSREEITKSTRKFNRTTLDVINKDTELMDNINDSDNI